MLRRGKRPTMGMMVEISQMANSCTMKWLPFMVTDVHEDETVSGVALSGMPGPLGWNNRGAQPFHGVESRAATIGMWRFKRGRQASDDMDDMDDMPDPEPDARSHGEACKRAICPLKTHRRNNGEPFRIPKKWLKACSAMNQTRPRRYTAPWVVDVQLSTVGDMIHLAVAYSDGTVENQQSPIAISTGAFYSDIPSGLHR